MACIVTRLNKKKKFKRNTCPNLERGIARARPSGGEWCQQRGQMHPTGTLDSFFCYCTLGTKQLSSQQTSDLFLVSQCSQKFTFVFLVFPMQINSNKPPESNAPQLCTSKVNPKKPSENIFNNMFIKSGFLSLLYALIWIFSIR